MFCNIKSMLSCITAIRSEYPLFASRKKLASNRGDRLDETVKPRARVTAGVTQLNSSLLVGQSPN